jgi:hypothetical protein
MGRFSLGENSDFFLPQRKKNYRGSCKNLSQQRQEPGKISVDPWIYSFSALNALVFPCTYGAPSMARAGQMSAQVPQSVQRAGSMLGCFSPAEMASRGHTARQSPQLVHFSVI